MKFGVILLTAMFYMTSVIDRTSGRSMKLKPLAMRGSRDLAIRKDPYAIAKCTWECATNSDCIRVEMSEDGSCNKKQNRNSVAGGSSGETLSIEGYTPSCTYALHSGLYTIPLPGSNDPDFISVFCQVDSARKWTVIQRRVDASVNFYRNWAEYKSGFGNLGGNFWLGNEAIHKLTADGEQTLGVEMENPNGAWGRVGYSEFKVADEADKYRLSYGKFTGGTPPGDAFNKPVNPINKMQFSTYDSVNNNMRRAGPCSTEYSGGWWYSMCHAANPNGVYGLTKSSQGITWYTWANNDICMVSFRLMIACPDPIQPTLASPPAVASSEEVII